MEKTKQIVLDLLNKGIEEKRKGNLNKALDLYKNALTEDPFYSVVYTNTAKVLIATGKYETAFRNILTGIHLRLLDNLEEKTPDYISFYQVDRTTFKKLNFNNIAVLELLDQSPFYHKIAHDINLTFYCGLCYIGENPNFLKHHKIKKSAFESEKEILLGKIPEFQNLRQTQFANLINIIGLKWIIDNIDIKIKERSKVIHKYNDPDQQIMKPDLKLFSEKGFNYTWPQIMIMIIKLPIFLIPDFFTTIYDSITSKNKSLLSRITDILIFPFYYILSPFILLIGAIVLKSEDRKNQKIKENKNYEKPAESTINLETPDSKDRTEENTDSWRNSLGGKSVLELLAEANVEAHSKNVFFCPIKEDEVIEILKNPTLESIWGQEKGNSKYTLFLMIYTNESITGLGNSEVREYFHCKLCRLIDTEGEYENGMLNGVYEFEIINKPQLDFSFKQSLKHIGKRIYIDRKLFEDNFVIPIFLEDTYDDQIKNTKGLENINFN